MTREQKIWRLRRRCGNIGHCDEKTCKIYAKCVNLGYTSFEQLSDEKINEMYNEVFGTQITENLTGVVKEDHERVKTVTGILEEVKQEMCDDYCKYPTIVNDREDLFADNSPCTECPLTKL